MILAIRFLDASTHYYMRVCPSSGLSIGPSVGLSVGSSIGLSVSLSIGPSVGNTFFFEPLKLIGNGLESLKNRIYTLDP